MAVVDGYDLPGEMEQCKPSTRRGGSMDGGDGNTRSDRVRVVGQLLGHAGEYGVVTALRSLE